MGESSVTLKLKPSDYSKAMWDKDFEATFTVGLTAESLDTELTVANTGSNAFDFQAALHRCSRSCTNTAQQRCRRWKLRDKASVNVFKPKEHPN